MRASSRSTSAVIRRRSSFLQPCIFFFRAARIRPRRIVQDRPRHGPFSAPRTPNSPARSVPRAPRHRHRRACTEGPAASPQVGKRPRISRISRSAVFLPMPGRRVRAWAVAGLDHQGEILAADAGQDGQGQARPDARDLEQFAKQLAVGLARQSRRGCANPRAPPGGSAGSPARRRPAAVEHAQRRLDLVADATDIDHQHAAAGVRSGCPAGAQSSQAPLPAGSRLLVWAV
jgi:hypothetical protein